MQTLSQGNFIIHQTEKVVNIYMKNFIKIIEILQIFLFFRLKYTKISAIIIVQTNLLIYINYFNSLRKGGKYVRS